MSDCTVVCGNSTIYVKLFRNCKHLSVGNRIKTSGSSVWCEYLNVPMCQTVVLWHTSPRPSLAVLARKLQPNLKPIHIALVIWHGGDLFQIWECVGSDVRLHKIFSSERSERATITTSEIYIYLILPCIYFELFPNFVSHFGCQIAL